jgi:hypothetical protein
MEIRKRISNMRVVINYLKSDLIKKQRSFKIGLFSIFLVILFVSLLLNFIGISPVIFLKLAEEQAGETDIIIYPSLINSDIAKMKEWAEMGKGNVSDKRY